MNTVCFLQTFLSIGQEYWCKFIRQNNPNFQSAYQQNWKKYFCVLFYFVIVINLPWTVGMAPGGGTDKTILNF